MRRAAPAGHVVAPLALLLAAGVAAGAAAAAAHVGSRGRVELELAGVLPMPDGSAGIAVLREKGTETILPIVVPDGKRLVRGAGREPGGLLRQAIDALGGRVAEVEIEAVDEASAGARVRLSRGRQRIELRAAPSDSIALAVATGAPIVTSRRLLDEAGLTPDDLARLHEKVANASAIRM